MKNLSRRLMAIGIAAMMGIGAASPAMAEDGKIEIAVTGGSEDAMQLNSATSGYLNGLSALRHLYEGLYKLDANGDVVLGQASDVQISDDQLTWTFTLRDDITWSDGQAVTANDFIFGFDNLAAQGGDYSTLLTDLGAAWEAPDEKTVVITLPNPVGFLPAILAFPSTYPARADYVEKFGDAYGTDPDKSVYNGPDRKEIHAHSLPPKKQAKTTNSVIFARPCVTCLPN